MQIGIFARVFDRPTLKESLQAAAAHGLTSVQFNLSDGGLPDLPTETLPEEAVQRINQDMADAGVQIAALSGTFNMIHPDVEKRLEGCRGLHALIGECHRFGTSVITLCTGTRDPDSMWRRHPDNDTPEAWNDMIRSICEVLPYAEEKGVILAFEPEVNNVVDSPQKARRLIDELDSPNLKVTMDGANVFHKGQLPRMQEVLEETFDLLGGDIALAHAKDLTHDGDAGHEAAGQGVLDYDLYLALLQKYGYEGALILHSLTEAQVPGCVAFIKSKL